MRANFFFQAEDGIRDYKVTGVQTCALPILGCPASRRIASAASAIGTGPLRFAAGAAFRAGAGFRLGERRVGEEGRARGVAYLLKKKKYNGQVLICYSDISITLPIVRHC